MFAGAVGHCYTGKSMRDRGRRCVVAEQRVRGVVGESSQMWDCACVGLLTKVRCGGGGAVGRWMKMCC